MAQLMMGYTNANLGNIFAGIFRGRASSVGYSVWKRQVKKP